MVRVVSPEYRLRGCSLEATAHNSSEVIPHKTSYLPALQRIGAAELLSTWWDSRSERTNLAYKQDIESFRKWLQHSEGLPVETADQAAQVILSAGQGTANRLAQGFQNYRKMLELCKDRKDSKGIRDYAILCTLYSLALRRSELVNTRLEHLDLDEGTLSVLGKGKTQRIKLTLPEPTKKALAVRLEVRGLHEGPLFYGIDKGGTLKGGLTGNGLYHLVKTLGKEVGISTRVHGIRHTSITRAVRAASAANLDLSKVMQFSRHSSLNVLEIYLDNERNYQGQISSLVAVGMEG